MFTIGDLIIYSAHGICRVDDICEKTISGITRQYYVLHPTENFHQLTISTPVDNEKVVMLKLMNQEEATELLDSFKYPGIKWVEHPNRRFKLYSDIVNAGDRKEITKVVRTLMQKKIEAEVQGKKLHEHDRQFLENTQHVLFEELAISLNSTAEEIEKMVTRLITE